MPDFVCLNGKIVPAAEARVSVFDHGFLYGDGLFETMRAQGTRIHLLEEHLNRLYQSAQVMDIDIPWSKLELSGYLTDLLQANKLPQSAVRLTVTRGEGLPTPDPASCQQPTLVITSRPVGEPAGEVYEKGIDLVILKTKRNLDEAFPVRIKSCNFLNNIYARQELKKLGAYEGLMLNSESQLTEGTISSIFFVKGGCLLTPSLECGILEGITRAEVIRLAREAGINTVEGKFTVEDICEAEEIFLTNAVSLIVPVKKIGNKTLPNVPGNMTRQLFQKLVSPLTKSYL